MYKNDRLNLILEVLGRRKKISVKELQSITYASTSTLRRDIITLENDHKIIRKYGQVELVKSKNIEFPYLFRKQENEQAKKQIADLAVDFVGDNMALFLDSSTTVTQMIPFLAKYKHLIVITNGIYDAIQLNNMPNIKTMVTSGRLEPGSGSILGNVAVEYLNNFRADLCFISCSSVDNQSIYMSNEEQASVKRRMQESSKQTILLCDASKIGRTDYFRLNDFSTISAFVTDTKPDQALITSLAESDVELVY
ncbi:DeoR/GlpR family DNA-binding transcription regulator [Agrilactobacillus fermenti]|uniref:DeoR/GlpR family DNA-binding transcription regulator n=1 Tax=Agrilactobacillus fermenti TaxID=2586909 RepID=UPI003A5C4F69